MINLLKHCAMCGGEHPYEPSRFDEHRGRTWDGDEPRGFSHPLPDEPRLMCKCGGRAEAGLAGINTEPLK